MKLPKLHLIPNPAVVNILFNLFKWARHYMSHCLAHDEGLRLSYRANIAMKIYDNQVDERPLKQRLESYDLKTKEGCNQMAEDIISLIFDS